MQIEENFDIKNLTSFKCGGKIKKVVFPESVDEFAEVLKMEPEIPVFGNLSNMLVSSDGFDGTIVVTTKMKNFSFENEFVTADCGLKGAKLSQAAAEKGLSGLEFMIAFPGTIGGEVFMNAGAHGQTISDILVEAVCFHPQKGLVTLNNSEMQFDYRTSICQKEKIAVLSAKFKLKPALKAEIQKKMTQNLEFRKSKQPSLALPNCGSVFRNPEGESAGRLLESSGAKGFSAGGAKVYENHANFIINFNSATSTDILELMVKMKNAVTEKYNIKLMPEVRFLGGKNQREVELCKILYQM